MRFVAVYRDSDDIGAVTRSTASSLKSVLLGRDRVAGERPAPGTFGKPFGVATDGFGRVVVADPATASVAVMDPQRHAFTTIGESSKQALFRTRVRHLLYVAEQITKRVQVFERVTQPK